MKLYIKNLKIKTILWVHDHEKQQRTFIVNLEIQYDAWESEKTNDIHDTLNYSEVEKAIVSFVEAKDYNLIETLTKDIIDVVIAFEKVKSCLVRVEKRACTKGSESMIIENYAEK